MVSIVTTLWVNNIVQFIKGNIVGVGEDLQNSYLLSF